MVHSIIYKSKAKKDFVIEDIHAMLLKAKAFNKKHNITGCIVYLNGQFIQLIEGKKADILSLYDDIKSDTRHFDVETLIDTDSALSLWNDWSMAMYDLSDGNNSKNHIRLLLESSFETANKKVKNSEVLSTFRKSLSQMIDHH